jgi:hypothetical protein
MPERIAKHHDRYMIDFLNRRTGSRIRVPHLITFALDKKDMLKVIGIVIKIEFYMLDDVYMIAIVNSHQRNNQSVILTQQDGTVSGMNQKAIKLWGEEIAKDKL